jgi:hypothetical protein
VRDRAVRWIAFCIKHWPTVKRQAIRLASLVGGLLILKREIYDVEHPEPLLIFLGLWLCGIAPAQFFDGLKKLGQEAKGSLDEAADSAPSTSTGPTATSPSSPEPPKPELKLVDTPESDEA